MQFHDYQRPELQRAPLRTDTTQRSYLSSPTRLHRPSGAPPNDSRRGMPLDFQGQGSNSHPIHYDYELGSRHSQSFRPPLNHPHDLQQLNNPHKSPTNDEQSRHAASMQTAAQAQRPQQIMLSPSGHQSVPLGIYNRAMPPGYRPSANMYPHQARDEGGIAPHDFLRDLPSQSQGFPRSGSRDYQSTPSTLYPGGPPRPGLQGFIPTQFPLSGGPRPPSDMFQAGSIFQSDNYSRYGPPPPGLGPGSGQLGASQQDMLATLFAGLGPRGGAGG